MSEVFIQLGLIIIIAGIMAYAARILKQPFIPAFILAGILLGPALGFVTDKQAIEFMSELGIAFLLFSAGLELNLKKLKEIGLGAGIGALIHMSLLFISGYAIFYALGYSSTASFYAGLVLIFSSTLLVVKLLAERKKLDTLHGRIIIGILLVQDIVAITLMSVLNSQKTDLVSSIALLLVQGLLVLVFGYILARITFNRIFKFAARNDELLFIMTITVLFSFSLIYAQIGFSIAIGAFIAGLLLGHLQFKQEITVQTKGLREFFAIVFFVSIGLSLTSFDLSRIWLPMLSLLFFMIIAVPAVIMASLSILGYNKRTSFLSAISLAQVSEFSLIIVRSAVNTGQLTQDFFNITIILSLITLSLTSYVIKYDERLYSLIGRKLGFLERLNLRKAQVGPDEPPGRGAEAIIVGYGKTGYSVNEELKRQGVKTLIIEQNPDLVKKLLKEEEACIHGDFADSDLLDRLSLDKVSLIVCTIPSHEDAIRLISDVKKRNARALIVVRAHEAEEALELYEYGADYVLVPYYLGGEHLSTLFEKLKGSLELRISLRVNHIKALHQRKNHHPQAAIGKAQH